MAASSVTSANRNGWRAAWIAFVVAMFGWGIGFYGPAVYLQTLHETLGWSISAVSTAVSAHFLSSAALIVWLPEAYRRLGVGRVTITGVLFAATGTVAWAHARQPWQLAPAVILSAAGWATTSGAALNAIVAPWFTSERGKAIGLAFNGASVGGIVFVPLWTTLITRWGLGWTAIILATAMTAVLCPLTRMFLWAGSDAGHSRGQHGSLSSRRRLLRQPRFLTISGAFALGLFAQIGLFAHLVARLTPEFGPSLAAVAISLTTICAIVGRTLVGCLLGQWNPRNIAAANLLVQALGTLLLAFGAGVAPLAFGCILFGLGVGNLTSLPPLIAQREFRPAEVGTVVALVTAINQAVFALAPAMLGWLKDSTRDYLVPFAFAACVQGLAAVIISVSCRIGRASDEAASTAPAENTG